MATPGARVGGLGRDVKNRAGCVTPAGFKLARLRQSKFSAREIEVGMWLVRQRQRVFQRERIRQRSGAHGGRERHQCHAHYERALRKGIAHVMAPFDLPPDAWLYSA